MLTETAGGINLAFNVDSQEDTYNDIRRTVPEVRIVELGDQTRPLEELTREQVRKTSKDKANGHLQESSRFVRSTGHSFDQPIYDFMVPAGRQEVGYSPPHPTITYI